MTPRPPPDLLVDDDADDASTQLSRKRTLLSTERSFLSFERTLMSWLRTSLSMISFGFTPVKFFESWKTSEVFRSSADSGAHGHPRRWEWR